MSSYPLVSIIMGIYNCADTLDEAIGSIIAQTYTNWELIMCDDCSVDKTCMIAEDYSKKYSNIKYIRNDENSGLAYSLNRCLELANGEYIARMDADDINIKDRFEKQVQFLNKNKQYDVVGSNMILFDEHGDKGIRKSVEEPDLKTLKCCVPHAHPTIMMRKKAYDVLNGYQVLPRTRRGQDADLWFRFYALGFKGYNIQEPLYKYHESENDFKKRSWKTAWGYFMTQIYGFKLMQYPIYSYFRTLRPLLAMFIPRKLKYRLKQK